MNLAIHYIEYDEDMWLNSMPEDSVEKLGFYFELECHRMCAIQGDQAYLRFFSAELDILEYYVVTIGALSQTLVFFADATTFSRFCEFLVERNYQSLDTDVDWSKEGF